MIPAGRPLSYCTNVHPGNSLDEVTAGLSRHAAAVRDRRGGGPLGTGLWLSAAVVRELSDPAARRRLADFLAAERFAVYTLNAFPFGDFHGRRVKENVYRPDWADPARLDYTLAAAGVLADLLPPGAEGSLSTLPLSFKPFHAGAAAPADRWRTNLVAAARGLHRLWRDTGRRLRLAVEPEPFCSLETTAEAVAFFADLFADADREGLEPVVREYVGVCLDVCHQAVEFEDLAESVAALARAGVRINKVHITAAVELPDPAGNVEGRRRLAEFVEERYLHQTFARLPDGRRLRAEDLTAELCLQPPAEWLAADAWRVHFHVPVSEDRLGPLTTTRPAVAEALSAVAGLDYAPDLEVETYTWGVLPEERRRQIAPDLAAGIAAELDAADGLLASLRK